MERWEARDQLRDETPEAYAIKLESPINQIEAKFRPSQYLQCLRFCQELKENIRAAMMAREAGFEMMNEVVVSESTKIDGDLGKKGRRPEEN